MPRAHKKVLIFTYDLSNTCSPLLVWQP